ncbi:MAG: 30S ribosomal protein S17 [Acidimicrobiia bacterium]|nr:30S ribosomal protein S17 [Acidimicrobiia bacterium]
MTDPTPEQSPAAEAAGAAAPATGPAATGRSRRKSREGVVASASMDRTAVVVVTEQVRHRRYNKTVRRHKRLYVHDEDNDLRVGDRVRVAETRPLSKLKRWRLVQILERAR